MTWDNACDKQNINFNYEYNINDNYEFIVIFSYRSALFQFNNF